VLTVEQRMGHPDATDGTLHRIGWMADDAKAVGLDCSSVKWQVPQCAH